LRVYPPARRCRITSGHFCVSRRLDFIPILINVKPVFPGVGAVSGAIFADLRPTVRRPLLGGTTAESVRQDIRRYGFQDFYEWPGQVAARR